MYLISLILGIRTWFSDSRDLKFSGKMHLHKNIHVKIRWQKLCLTPSLSVVFGEIPYSVLSNSTTHQQIVLESCSNPIHSVTLHWKKNWGSGFHFFAGDFVSGVGFGHFGSRRLLAPGPKPLDGSISLKFLLETRLESESFEPLIDLLVFWFQKLSPKSNEITN